MQDSKGPVRKRIFPQTLRSASCSDNSSPPTQGPGGLKGSMLPIGHVPALGQPGALKTPLVRPPTASKTATETKTPGSQETSALALAQTLSCLLQFFLLAMNTPHTPDCLASQQHLQVMLTAGEMGKIKAAPGDEKARSALCQPSPVILSCYNLHSFYRTTLSVPQKLSYFWQISQGPPLNQDKFLSAPAPPVIYNNLHSLIVSLKYHCWKNSSALLQRTWSKVFSSFKPESMLLLTTTLAQNHLL